MANGSSAKQKFKCLALWLDELQCVGKQEDGKMHVYAVGLVCLFIWTRTSYTR